MEETHIHEEDVEAYGPWGKNGVPESITRLVLEWFVHAYEGFHTSDHFEHLADTDKLYAYAATRSFIIMMLFETGETPSEWSQPAVEYAFEELLPHDLPQATGYDLAFVPVVLAFVDWLADVGALSHARQIVDWIKPYLEYGHERCECSIRTETKRVAERVMKETGMNPTSLFDQAIYIAKYTATICNELDDVNRGVSLEDESQLMSLNLLCHCGSGKQFDQCCGGVN